MGVANSKGSLAKGKDADILIFDEDIKIQMTMVAGKVVHHL
ncbi:amidohydrolase family protein [Chitinophaga sp. Ak27]|nr:amidohydrolase family protein [Chitinophaga sp. Ak27]NLU94921.1 amidohydrolase family protein [Chitinophaga sp. Ak27]